MRIKALLKVAAVVIGCAIAITVLILLVKAVEIRSEKEKWVERFSTKIELQQDIQTILRHSNVFAGQQLSDTLEDLDVSNDQVNQLIAQVSGLAEDLRVSEDVLTKRNQEFKDLEEKVAKLGELEEKRDKLAADLEAKKNAEAEVARKAAQEEIVNQSVSASAVVSIATSYSDASPLKEPANCPHSHSFTGNVSGYSSTPDQTYGNPYETSTGTRVHWGTVAVDPNHIPYGCRIVIDGFPDTVFVAEDTGGAVLGYWNRVDIWFPSRSGAEEWGRRWLMVTVV